MSRDQQAQVNNRSGNIVCDNIRVKEDIILSGNIRGQQSVVNFQGDIDVIGKLSVSELIRTPSVRLTQDPFEILLRADPGLSESYTYTFPPSGPSGDGQVVATSGGGGSAVFYDIHPAYEIWVRKNPGVGEYSSLASALAAIPLVGPWAPGSSTPWVVRVDAGVYLEPAIVFPASYIYVVGVSMEGVSFEPSGSGYPLFTFASNTGLSFAGIYNCDPLYPACVFQNVGDFCLMHKVTFDGCSRCINFMTDSLAIASGQLYLEYVDMTSATNYSLLVSDSNLIGGFGSYCSIENYFTFEHSDDAIIVSGLNSSLLAHACELSGDGTGNGLTVSEGAIVNIRSMAVIGYTNGLFVPNDATVPDIKTSGVIFTDCSVNINILNPLCSGYYSGGFSEYIKTVIPKASPFFINGQDQLVITVAKKGGNFTSVVAALAAITDNSPTVRYTISVGPGIFVETQIVMKPYVTLSGFAPSTTILAAHPSIAGTPFVVGAYYSSVTKLTLACADYAFPPSYLVEYLGDPTGNHFRCDLVVLDSSLDLIHIGSTLGPCIFVFGVASLINMSAPFRRGFYIEDSGPSNYPITFSVDNLLWGADAVGVSNFTEMFVIESFKSPSPSQNIFGAVTNSSFGTNFHGPVGKGFSLVGSVYVVIETCLFGGLALGVEVASSAEPTFMILTNSTISNNTEDILVSSAVAFGTISVNATLSKVVVDPASAFGIQINDAFGGIAFGGDMYQGLSWNQITNISEQIQHASTCGIIDSQTTVAGVGGLNISVGSGSGYVFIGYLKYVVWTAVASMAIADNTLSWIYVDSGGVVGSSLSSPDPIANIIIGTVKTYSGGITYIQEVGHVLDNLSSNIDGVLRDTWGPVVKSGCLAAPGSNGSARAVMVSSGAYSLGVSQYPPVGGDNVSMIGYYGGSIETAPFTNIPLQWDNAGVLTAIGAGKWVKHTVYILSSLTGVTQYFFVYGQEQFATELDAQNGGIPIPPTTFTANMCPVAGVIVTDSDPSSPLASSRFRDIRPTLGFRSEGSTASADHNSLLNLTVGNAHPQYFRVDGTSAMTGNVDLGTQNIVGSGGNLLNGVDLLAHAARHLPGGADALTTAAPVGVGAANSIGAAASFARSDHVHAGVSSFAGGTTGLTPTGTTTGDVTLGGILAIANGGTNSSTTLNNNRIMVSSAGKIAEASALTNGQLLIGSTGAAPVAAAITAGSNMTVTNGAGTISIGTTIRYTLPPSVLTATASVTNQLTNISTSFTIPAGYITSGTTFRIDFSGTANIVNAGATNSIQVMIGTSNPPVTPVIFNFSATGTVGSSQPFTGYIIITCRSNIQAIGSGTVFTQGAGFMAATAWSITGSTVAINNSSTSYLAVWSATNNGGNTISYNQVIVSQI